MSEVTSFQEGIPSKVGILTEKNLSKPCISLHVS